MNPRLEIKLETFMKDPKIRLKNVSREQFVNVLSSVEIFERVKGSKDLKN